MHPKTHGRKAAALARLILPFTLIAAPLAASAQKACDTLNRTQCSDLREKQAVTHVFYLNNVSQQNDANEVLVALRNILSPAVKIYLVASQNAIVLHAFPDEIDEAQTIINDLTHPRRAIHLHYTLRILDGSRVVSTEHYDLDAMSGQRVTLKQGRKVPVVTGALDKTDASKIETQFTYLDVGASIDVTPTYTGNDIVILSKVERSDLSGTSTIANIAEPIVHQSVISGVATLVPGKPTELGRADIDGTTQHIEVEVTADPVS